MICWHANNIIFRTMQQPPSTENPVRWTTRLVLDWMRKYDDSREEVKKKILDVIERNDIDGLTLKQLRADSEEIHTLFPSLKERLTFKAMLRDIFKDVKCCNNNGCNNNSFCNQDAMNHAKSPTQQQPPTAAAQLSPKFQNAHAQANHKHGSSYPRSEDANQKSSGQAKRSSPHLLSRPVLLPRQESKENNQVIHVDTSPPTSRAKISPIAVSMVANTQSTLPARERDLTSAQMQRFISPQGLHTNQLLTHTSPPATATMYPFPPIAGQFNVSVANQALAAALAARGLSHQQPYQQSQSQSPATVGSPVGGGSRPSPYVPQSHPRSLGSTSSAASAVTTAASAPQIVSAAAAQQVVEIVDKDDPDSPSTSTSAADQNSHSASSPVPVALPLVSTRGRPATKGAIRSAKISQKYRKIIQRMKSAHKQVIEIPYPAPLPGFSQLLRQQIGRGNIANFRSRFTYECAQYYMSLNPTPSHTEYRNISKTVVENFPVLSSPDEDVPWRKFNNHLSQAIRNIRRQLRSVPNSGYPPAQKRKYWRNLASQVMCGSALSLTHLTPQQQQQQMSQVMHGSGPSTDHCFDEGEGSLDDKEVIVLKEDKDDDDDEEDVDDETEGFKGDDNVLDEGEDEDDGIIPAEWVNKRK